MAFVKNKDGKKDFLMLVGVPASGKSFFMNQYKKHYTKLACYSTDTIITDWARQMGISYSAGFSKFIMHAQKVFEGYVTSASIIEKNILIDRTNVSEKSRKKILDLLDDAAKYNKYAIVMETDPTTIKERLFARNEYGQKIISPEVFKAFEARFEYPIESEGFDGVFTAETIANYFTNFLATTPPPF